MRKAVFVVACCALVAVTGCKRKLKLEGKVTGFKPGTDTLMLHVVSEKGAYVTCQPPGYGCKTIDIGANGQADVELETQAGQTEKKVHLRGKLGPAENTIVIDPAASMPPAVKVSSNKYVECIAKECSGSIDVVPAGRISLKAPAGTVVDIGSDKLTVPANGQLDAPWNPSPAAKDQTLTRLFDNKTVFGSSNLVLTFPDKAKVSTRFDLTADGASAVIANLVKGVASGPVLFPWEKGAPAKGRAVALYCRGLFCVVGGAPDATWAELRVVALSEEKAERKGTCSYTNRSTGKPATASLTMHDHLATAYERATGRKLGTKLFEAPNLCDHEVSGSLTAQDSHPLGSVVAQWAAGFAR